MNYANISYQIDQQFPAIYREHGQELIELVKAYYSFCEKTSGQSIHDVRRMPIYRDIDTTMSSMLLYFKNKYLNDLPFEEDSIRFTVKHILDLYRRKGTAEGIELFFRMFYDETITIYYPSVDVLKPSASTWKVGSYLELYTTDRSLIAADLTGKEISGSISGAKAIVDFITFVTVGYVTYPTLFLSQTRGSFTIEDRLFTSGVQVGRVRGSLQSVTIDAGNNNAGNKVGDIVSIESSSGYQATGRISQVVINPTGSIPFDILDGGYGYTISGSTVYVSSQLIFFNNTDLKYKLFDKITQGSTEGFVVAQTPTSIGIRLYDDLADPFVDGDIETPYGTVTPIFISNYNVSAKADVGTLSDIQEIDVYTDRLSSFLDVPLSAANFSDSPALEPMTGNAPDGIPAINLDTVIADAFIPMTIEVGSIATFMNINPGYDYQINPTIEVFDHHVGPMGVKEQVIKLVSSSYTIPTGTVVIQSNGAKGIVSGRLGAFFKIIPRSFTRFVKNIPLNIGGQLRDIDLVLTDYSSKTLGHNAVIDGDAIFTVGQVQSVTVLSSGYGFANGQKVRIKNITRDTGDITCYGTAIIGGQGKTAGSWGGKSSQLNSNKKIQDSYYYQDYSYEISSKVAISNYSETFKKIAHPAGTKLFGKFTIEDTLNKTITIDTEIEIEE